LGGGKEDFSFSLLKNEKKMCLVAPSTSNLSYDFSYLSYARIEKVNENR